MAKTAQRARRTTQSRQGSAARPAQATATAASTEDPNVIERIAMAPDDRLMLTPTEAARRLSISRALCYRLMGSGALPSLKLGGARRVPVAALDAFVAAALATGAGAGVRAGGI